MLEHRIGSRPVESLTISVLIAGGFAATNVDNLMLLISWMAVSEKSRGQLFAGYALATFAVLGVSLVLGFSSGMLPVQYIGYLGLVPILFGAKMLVASFRQRPAVTGKELATGPGAISVGTVLFSNSVDTILIVSPLLGDTEARLDYVIVGAYLVMATAWYALGHLLHSNIARLNWVPSVARWLAPLLMITVGIYILDNTLTDTLAGS